LSKADLDLQATGAAGPPGRGKVATANQARDDTRIMPPTARHRLGDSRPPRPAGAKESSSATALPPLPLYQHPVVAGSLILIAAAVAQVLVWLVWTRSHPARSPNPSSLVAHGLLQDLVRDAASRAGAGTAEIDTILHVASLLLALWSGVAWYGIARLGLGPKWGFWVGLCWVIHPSFAFPANQIDKLSVLAALVSAGWCTLLWWRLKRKTIAAAMFGLLLAVTCTAGFQGFILLAIALPAMLLSGRTPGWKIRGVLTVVTGFAVSLVLLAALVAIPQASARMATYPAGTTEPDDRSGQTGAWTQTLDRIASRRPRTDDAIRLRTGLRLLMLHNAIRGDIDQILIRLDTDLRIALDDTSGSFMAWSSAQSRPPAIVFLVSQCRAAPRQTALWLAGRLRASLYATTDGQVHYPLVILQFVWLIPALWGWWIAFRYRPWRWLAVTGGLYVLSQWAFVGIAEPLARNLMPVGGFAVLFALVGATDVYERFFGRRLTSSAPTSRPARLRRGLRKASDAGGD
jgi:hypothetical protein